MFKPVGFFKSIPCPEGAGCSLLNCMFAHGDKESTIAMSTDAARAEAIVSAPTIDTNEGPMPKKRRISLDYDSSKQPVNRSNDENTTNKTSSAARPSIDHKQASNGSQPLRSAVKTISPPPLSRKTHSQSNNEHTTTQNKIKSDVAHAPVMNHPVLAKKESLNPRHLSKPPASHSVRMSILVKLHEGMVQLNDRLRALNDESKKALVLSQDELICRALDEEEKVAKESSSVYSNVIKLRITKLRRMQLSDWEQDVLSYLRSKTAIQPIQASLDPETAISTGLNAADEVAFLSRFLASPEVQAKAGYVMEPPTKEEVHIATSGGLTAQGWEQCDRCNGRFQVFPGRREDGLLASGGSCTYHHAKLVRPPRKKTDHIVGQTEPYFPCCNETVGTSTGCTKADTHVYKVTEVKRLAAILQFERTPRQDKKGPLPPVCFDCEMGYTTLGLELIRLTAITWPERKKVVDVLVRPMGEILDLNTRYSGVLPEQFANAVPYRSDQDPKGSPDNSVLPIVDSPAAARALLFEHLQPETPIIGHAIDNDLNACRIIHPTIVDTVFLYPHPAGLPYRFGLRALAKKYLDRHIQTGGGDRGHDSMEDARATGDLVRVKVRETWQRLKTLGWTIRSGKLVEPEPSKANSKALQPGTKILGAGAGTKRTAYDDGKDSPKR